MNQSKTSTFVQLNQNQQKHKAAKGYSSILVQTTYMHSTLHTTLHSILKPTVAYSLKYDEIHSARHTALHSILKPKVAYSLKYNEIHCTSFFFSFLPTSIERHTVISNLVSIIIIFCFQGLKKGQYGTVQK